MMRDGLYWREQIPRGGQPVAGPFASAVEAGEWRRDHPPLQKGLGPTLIAVVDGVPCSPEPADLAEAFTVFVPGELAEDVTA